MQKRLPLSLRDWVHPKNDQRKSGQSLKSAFYLCMMKILMVCLGNICRSPLAEGILRQKAQDNGLHWTIDSAGTNGYHTGEAPHHLSQKVAKVNGIDISNQVSRKFSAADFDRYDMIYVMADDVLRDVKKLGGNKYQEDKVKFFLEELEPGEKADVPDPWYGDEDGYIDVYRLIEKTCDAIVQHALTNTDNEITK
jgi:protein-tyrosine phosphatase